MNIKTNFSCNNFFIVIKFKIFKKKNAQLRLNFLIIVCVLFKNILNFFLFTDVMIGASKYL